MDFYKSTKWEKKRNSILRRDGYMCQLSKRYGLMKQAEVVHHIFPRDEFPQYEMDDWNLISLTTEQHHHMHNRDTNELTEAGAELLRRTARRQGIEVPDKYKNTIRKPKIKSKRRMNFDF